MLFLLAALVAINGIAFLAFAVDKRAAIDGGWRIRESTLLAIAFFGGSIGALIGQQVLRHKTRKQPFRSLLIAIGIAHLALAVIVIADPDLAMNTIFAASQPAYRNSADGP